MSARPRVGLVYFMKPAGLDGPIKIGFSWCPAIRLLDLTAWSPWPLELIGAVSGTGKDERFLHSCFADSHSHREWFHSTPRLRDAIDKILRDGQIDLVRNELKPLGSIRLPRKNSPEATERMSYRMRIYWVLRKLEKSSGLTSRYRMPADIQTIMDDWHQGWRRIPRRPSIEDFARLEAFISSNGSDAVCVERKLKVVA